jgi:surfactin family lipopeptide synthetase B
MMDLNTYNFINLFEQRVQQAPQHIALIGDNRQYSYQELNEAANQLAHYLKQHGAGSEKTVALYLTPAILGKIMFLRT